MANPNPFAVWCPRAGPPCVAAGDPALAAPGAAVEFTSAAECAALCTAGTVLVGDEAPLGPAATVLPDEAVAAILARLRGDPSARARLMRTSTASRAAVLRSARADAAARRLPNPFAVPRAELLQLQTRGLETARFTGHTNMVRDVAVTPDGTRAVTTSDDGTAIVWDLATRLETARFTGHTEEVLAVAVTPDGTRAVTTSYDNTAIVWDLATGVETARFTGHTEAVSGVAVTPDGTRAVTAS